MGTLAPQEHCLRILSGLTLWPEAAAKLLHAGYIDCIIAAMLILGENQGNLMGIFDIGYYLIDDFGRLDWPFFFEYLLFHFGCTVLRCHVQWNLIPFLSISRWSIHRKVHSIENIWVLPCALALY